jgi:hypothetical protein
LGNQVFMQFVGERKARRHQSTTTNVP